MVRRWQGGGSGAHSCKFYFLAGLSCRYVERKGWREERGLGRGVGGGRGGGEGRGMERVERGQ